MLGRTGSASEEWYVGVAYDCTALVSSSGPTCTLHNDYIIHEYTVKTANYVTSCIHNASNNCSKAETGTPEMRTPPVISYMHREVYKIIPKRVYLLTCITNSFKYHRTVFNCEYLLIADCEFFLHSQLIDSQT